MGILASIGAVASAASIVYPIAESIIKEQNAKKASEIRKRMDQVLSRYNLKLSQIKDNLEQMGLNYNVLMDKLRTVSPSSSGAKIRDEASKEYYNAVVKGDKDIRTITDQMNQYSAIRNKEASDLESKGVIRTITEGLSTIKQ
jgi:hypothetical protein